MMIGKNKRNWFMSVRIRLAIEIGKKSNWIRCRCVGCCWRKRGRMIVGRNKRYPIKMSCVLFSLINGICLQDKCKYKIDVWILQKKYTQFVVGTLKYSLQNAINCMNTNSFSTYWNGRNKYTETTFLNTHKKSSWENKNEHLKQGNRIFLLRKKKWKKYSFHYAS